MIQKNLQTVSSTAKSFLDALEAGLVCLHPSETLPGLSFHPNSEKAKKTLYAIKTRDTLKTVVSLVASLERAESFWKPLPPVWKFCLEKLWPSSLTVIWEANSKAPASLVSEKGLLALRAPKFQVSSLWMQEVLENFSQPLPSTSVNKAGEPSLSTWEEACDFCSKREEDIFIPVLSGGVFFQTEPSTIILLEGDLFQVLREGAFPVEKIFETKAKWLTNN
jgi:tRNA threonylcarbamoyl adenosine modification protein (Sua5/YciO/YrdC/YwlC family)